MASTTPSTKYTSKLRGKRVLIFGGTSGIGYGVTEASIEFGATVIISGSRQPKIEKTIERVKEAYGSDAPISGHECDLTNTEALEPNLRTLLDFATKDGKIDHIVFTAGDAIDLVTLPEATIERVHKLGIVRFYAPIILAKLAPSYMLSSADSSITLTGGANSTKPGDKWSVLAGWGAGVEGLTRGLAVDLKPIRVNCVAPGAIHTELFQRFGKDKLDEVLDHYRSRTKTGTIGKPEDIAESYLYCMKDSFVTGTILHSNGGYFLV